MKASAKFQKQPPEFWANVRTISQAVGYTVRDGSKTIKVPTLAEVQTKFKKKLKLNTHHIADQNGKFTALGKTLFEYFEFRAEVLNKTVQKLLMKKDEAEREFLKMRKGRTPKCHQPMNKQKKAKKNFAFFTCMINLIVEDTMGEVPCNYNPGVLTTVTKDGLPVRTLARRVDGAFPDAVNPIAIWEIKEYYYTTTFGSRVADGVYETLLDGMELKELEDAAHHKIWHVLFLDDHFTWWEKGRSYLCRVVDMLHMGYVDEVIFGREVLTRLPELALEWKAAYEKQGRRQTA